MCYLLFYVYLQVIKAYDHKTRSNVALKIVRNEKRFSKQANEEIRILKHLRQQVIRFILLYFIVTVMPGLEPESLGPH